jgi:hypothetical protein
MIGFATKIRHAPSLTFQHFKAWRTIGAPGMPLFFRIQVSSLLGSRVVGAVMGYASGSLCKKSILAIDAEPPLMLQSDQSQLQSSINISQCLKMAFRLHFCWMPLSQRFPTATLKNKHHRHQHQAQDHLRQLPRPSRDQQDIMSLLLLQCPPKLRPD